MNRQFGTKIILILFTLAVTCFGIKTAIPALATGNSKKANYAHQSEHLQDIELKGIHFSVIGAHIAAQKNFVRSIHNGTCYFQKYISSENDQIRSSALLLKDYLLHIYPSHNFW